MSFKIELESMTAKIAASRTKEVNEIIARDDARVLELGIEDSALQIGDRIPEFELYNAVGETINSYDLLSDGPMVISFYRGAWCPYCNIELRAYQRLLPEIKALGAQLVAISPELPDNSLSLIDKHSLQYEILSDIDNKIAKAFGLVFSISKEVKEIYDAVGIDIEAAHGNTNNELPIPATYVIDSDGTVLLSHVDSNFRNRLDPEEVLEVIRTQTY